MFFNTVLWFMSSFTAHAIGPPRENAHERKGLPDDALQGAAPVAVSVPNGNQSTCRGRHPWPSASRMALTAGWNIATSPTATCASTIKCKILLPKFNTWRLVLLERENGFEVPLGNAFSWFFAIFS